VSQQIALEKSTSPVRSTWLEWTMLLIGLGLISVTEAFRLYTLVGLALLLGAFALLAVQRHSWRLQTWIAIPGFVFLFSAALATVISYNRGPAFLQFVRFAAAGVLFFAIAGRKIRTDDPNSDQREAELRWIGIGILALAAGLAVYWPLHQDYSSATDKIFLITNILQWIPAHLPPVPGPDIQSNVAAGTLILAVPLGFGLIADARRRKAFTEAVLEATGVAIVLSGLFLTGSRGAWGGLAVAPGVAVLVLVQQRWFNTAEKRIAFWIIVGLGGLALIGALTFTGYSDRLVGQIPDPTGALQSRTTLWSEGIDLIHDYIFTGSGLMSVPRVFAIYELLIAVPFMSHLHNLYLEVWLEQGVLGEIALVSVLGMAVSWAWKALTDMKKPYSGTQAILGWAGLAGVLAIAVHGLVDVVFYVERTVPLVGLILGYAYLASPLPDATVSRRSEQRHRLIWGTAIILSLQVISLPFYRQILSAFYANIGAVEQTRMEMSVYDPDNFQNDSLDQVRQRLKLEGVQVLFRKSLSLNPNNRVALLRLGDIALSYQDETEAQKALQADWDAGYRDNRTRLLYGDLLVMQGQVQAAASIQKGVPWAVGRLSGQAWYRYWVNNDFRRALDAWKTVLLLEPSNQNASYWSEQAVQQMNAKNP
jgi:O-antigen ligase